MIEYDPPVSSPATRTWLLPSRSADHGHRARAGTEYRSPWNCISRSGAQIFWCPRAGPGSITPASSR